MSYGKGGYECDVGSQDEASDMEVDDDKQAGASMHNDRKRKRNDDEKNKRARAHVPREGRFITKNRRRPPSTALAVLRQSSVRPFKMQRILHPPRCIPSAHNLVAGFGTTMRDFGSNMNTLVTNFGGGLTNMFCVTVNAVKDVVVATVAAVPPVAQATVPWIAQATIAMSTLTGLALQSPAAVAGLAGVLQVVRRGGVWQALMANLGYLPPT